MCSQERDQHFSKLSHRLIRIGDVQVIESGDGGLDPVDDIIDFGGQGDNVFPVERSYEDLIQVPVNLAGDLIPLLFEIVEFLDVSGRIQVLSSWLSGK